MMDHALAQPELINLAPSTTAMLKEVLFGLSRTPKSLPPKFLYDKKGSEIFEKICLLKDYYPTRAETEILKSHAGDIARIIGEDAMIIEPGSGAGEKIKHLLPELNHPAGYVPMEISKEILLRMTEELHESFPELPVFPVCADFFQDIELPEAVEAASGKKVIFFPGSTIGNLTPQEATQFLKRMAKLTGHSGGLLIGVDLKKDRDIFIRAYDDSEGVTADFNLNLLERLNREISANFRPENFLHEARYNEDHGRVEMHLVSKLDQLVRVNETVFRFLEGETIHTESSYKYSVPEFVELCGKAKWEVKKVWKDNQKLFCVYYFEQA